MVHVQAISTQIVRIVNKLIFIEKKSIFQFQGVKLYPSELHLLQVIEPEPDLNTTDMANRLGVTKGAVSQTLSRLERKGIVVKSKDPYQKNRLTAGLTNLGKAAIKGYHLKSQALQNEYEYYLSTLSEKDRAVIGSFLKSVEGYIDRLG